MPDRVSPSLGKVPPSLSRSSPVLHPLESASESDGPLFPTPYTLPSGVNVTEDSVSIHKESIASLLLKNCMLRKDIEGILECSSHDELHNTFSHFQLRATEYAMVVRDGLLKSKSDLTHQYEVDIASLKRSLEESEQSSQSLKTRLDTSQLLLSDTEKRLVELSLRPSPEAVIETFKKIDTYNDLLNDNTVSIMKNSTPRSILNFVGSTLSFLKL
ncbi:hypothetical protein LIER_40736 [Lithospermum erythrorhizon]|uniref:Uncharacterized protein n=1 Tax=Lithospermum erythrorhizon TaxID=34254 RepID=A0AAV3R280_LITER